MNKYFLLLFLFPSVCFGALSTEYEQGFESEPLGTFHETEGNCSPRGFDANHYQTDDCSTQVVSEYPARTGTKYLRLKCNYTPGADPDNGTSNRGEMYREDMVFRGWSGNNGNCTSMMMNDGSEYWIGFSTFFEPGYVGEMHDGIIMQLHNNTDPNASITAQKDVKPLQFKTGSKNGLVDSHYIDSDTDWKDKLGEWVDIVVHFVPYNNGDNVNAKLEFYVNGVLDWENNGQQNTGLNYGEWGDYPIFYLDCYNWAYKPSVTPEPSTHIHQYDVAHYRSTAFDEIRLTEQAGGSGDAGYCDVAPPIWSKQRAILYPTDGSSGIATDFSMTYAGYLDHRDDPQNCYAYKETTVQIDEEGGDWTTLVHDSTSDAETSKAITGLSEGVAYQARIIHTSNNADTTEDYIGGDDEWSEVITFTTSVDIAVSPGLGTFPMIQ